PARPPARNFARPPPPGSLPRRSGRCGRAGRAAGTTDGTRGASPPLGSAGGTPLPWSQQLLPASGGRQPVYATQLLFGEGEAEHVEVGGDPLRGGRLGDHHHLVVDMPADHDLS